MHPANYHAEAKDELEGRVVVKKSESESVGLSRLEAQLITQSVQAVNLNAELLNMTEGRSLEAIKGRRKTEKHRKLVQEFLTSLATGNLVFDLPPLQVEPEPAGSHEVVLPSTTNDIDLMVGEVLANDEGNFNMDASTEVYTSIETYIHSLNTDTRLGVPTSDEINLVARTLVIHDSDGEMAKSLAVSFLDAFYIQRLRGL